MATDADIKRFTDGLTAPSDQAWRAVAAKGLGGADPDERLAHRTLDDIVLKPLYTRADGVATAAYAASQPGTAPYLRGRTPHTPARVGAWDIRQRYAASDAATANARILDDLTGGVNSLTLQMAAPGQSGLEANLDAMRAALNGAHLDMIDVTVEAGEDWLGAAQGLMAIWSERGISESQCRGGFHADPIGATLRAGAIEGTLYSAIETLGQFTAANVGVRPNASIALADGRVHHEAGASDAQELAATLATAVSYLRAAERGGSGLAPAVPTVHAALALDTDLFTGIAKVRALRRLIWRMLEAAGAGTLAGQVRITGETSARVMGAREPHINMLRTTVAAMAGAMAGCDSLMVRPFTSAAGIPDEFAHRMARNTQIMLQEETGLGVVADPAGGSWYVEHLCDALARKAWELFQWIEESGGMEEVVLSGRWQEDVANAAEARAKTLATGHADLVGASTFAHVDADPVVVPPFSAQPPSREGSETVTPLAPRRLASQFEALRTLSDAVASQAVARPTVFLATVGEQKTFGARQGFARNLLATAGISATDGPGGTDTNAIAEAFHQSGTPVACICATDEDYQRQSVELTKALKDAGATAVYLAGRPGDVGSGWDESALYAAGLTGLLHMRSDRTAVLSDILTHLGLSLHDAGVIAS